MDEIISIAPAKINLSIDVLCKRTDGYHEIKTIMQAISLYDSILIQKKSNQGIKIRCNLSYVPTNENNIVYKAAERMINNFNIKEGVYIDIQKNIPVSAGLGGGSSDCATTLKGLNKLFGLNLSREELMKLGAEFGADVPYFILGKTALAEGIGERLTQLNPLHQITVLLCKPNSFIKTSSVYNSLELDKINKRPDFELLISAINNGDMLTLSRNMVNVLETVTLKTNPEVKAIKDILIKNNSLGALMSGSGTSVFGLFENRGIALKAMKQLKNYSKNIFLTNTI